LSKKWQEAEFLDYKERQIRRRTQRSKALLKAIEQAAPPARGLKVVLVLAVLVAGGLVGFVTFQDRIKALRAQLLGGRTVLTVTEVRGDVEIGTTSRAAGRPKVGDRFEEALTVSQPAGARVAFGLFWKPARLVVQDKAKVEIGKVILFPDKPDMFRVKVQGQTGTVLAEIRQGEPLIEIVMPQGSLVYGGKGMFRVALDEKESVVIVRDNFVRVTSSDKVRKASVEADQRMIVKKGEEWDKPAPYSTPETVWK
jgi:hypothetical protein